MTMNTPMHELILLHCRTFDSPDAAAAAADDPEPDDTAAPLEPEPNPLPKGQLFPKGQNDTPEAAADEPPTETTAC
jgi:hypothetical protein